MKKIKIFLTASMAITLPIAGQAAILLLDFGPTAPTGSDLTNSPFHSEKASTVSNWNTVGTADVASGLVYGDGSVATGVELDLGVSANSNLIDFSSQPASSSNLGSFLKTGVYAGTSVGKDGIFSGSAADLNIIGLQVTGLEFGMYNVYVLGANTNEGYESRRSMEFGAFATTDTATWDTNLLSTSTVANPDGGTDSWNLNSNYAKISVTLDASNPVLSVFSYGTAASYDRGFLNAVEIVAVPEPSSFALFSGLLVLGLMVIRRRAKA